MLTLIAMTGFVIYARALPPDELVMANTLSFQGMVSALVVGLPSCGLLLVFMLVGAMLKRQLHQGVHSAK